MASGLHKYTVVEAQNAALGQAGSIFKNDTDAVTGKKIVAIQFIEDTLLTTLTPSNSEFIGTSGGNGDDIHSTDDTFPQGMTIFGQWTAVTLASGAAIIYLGTF
tara:strand:+ start:542 stop:853 length:312 start_codon:yes stop_codon:yes gene_type:complete